MIETDATNSMESRSETFLIEAGKSTHFLSKSVESAKSRPWWLWVLFGIFIILVGLVLAGYLMISSYVKVFEEQSGESVRDMFAQVRAGMKEDAFLHNERKNFLILGLDEIANQKEGSLLTDTIMVASVEKTGDIHLISIPRDLWIQELQTKINALYYYGEESESTTGEELTTTVVEDVTGLTIDYPLVLKLSTLRDVIDTVGGVTVEVEKGFTDTEFPRSNVDPSLTDKELLYETVTFEEGEQVFDGETALKFIRSRHSEDEDEGNDMARSKRQRQVVRALFNKLVSFEVVSDPKKVARLYTIWKDMGEPVHLRELSSMGKGLYSQEIQIVGSQIPVQDEDVQGLIINPPIEKHALWVYEPLDPTWKDLKAWVQQELN